MFCECRYFNSDLSKWNVKNVTNMFDNAINFTSDLSEWNVKNVTNMSKIFSRAESFNSDLLNFKFIK